MMKDLLFFVSSYEHHSNELIWREGHAEVVKIGLTDEGLFDLKDLVNKLEDQRFKNRLKVGSFSAASNVTGIKSPVYDIAKIMHHYGGYVFFDYASAGPYVEINMIKDDACYFDGIFLSMHKFLGGPGASGLLVLNKDVYPNKIAPTVAGGGTVKYVTENDHEYVYDTELREDAGTPAIMQVIRAAMAMEVKDVIGTDLIERVESNFIKRAMDELSDIENLEILGNTDPENRLAIMSFNIRYKSGYLHHGFITTLLNDLFGIQSRAGCACAGPYGIKLLNIDENRVERFKEAIRAEIGPMKPGWTRLNFHYTLDEETFNFILEAIRFVAFFGHQFLEEYQVNCVDGSWSHRNWNGYEKVELSLLDAVTAKPVKKEFNIKKPASEYTKYLKQAHKIRPGINTKVSKHELFASEFMKDIAWFYYAPAE